MKLKVWTFVFVLVFVLTSSAISAQMRQDFEIDPDAAFKAARDKFMYDYRDDRDGVLEYSKPFFDAMEKSEVKYVSTYRGKFGDCVIFLCPDFSRDADGNPEWGSAIFNYPSLELISFEGTAYMEELDDYLDRLYDWVLDEYMDPSIVY